MSESGSGPAVPEGATLAAGFRAAAVLRDGTPVCLRAMRPDDKERVRTAFGELSPRSIYRRFLHPVTALTPGDLGRVTEVDFRDHVALAVTIEKDDGEHLIAEGRFVCLSSDAGCAEVAFTVADAYQRRGAATLLLQQLVGLARNRGVRAFVANMFDDNVAMFDVLRKSGLTLRQSVDYGIRRVELSLRPDEHRPPARVDRTRRDDAAPRTPNGGAHPGGVASC